MRHDANVTKYKCDKMQIRQNAKIPYMNNPKYKRNSILGFPIENQCVLFWMVRDRPASG